MRLAIAISVLLFTLASCDIVPSGAPCSTTADCCQEGPSSLCASGTCEANPFCAQDPNCYGSRFGVCNASTTVCGDGICHSSERTSCAADCSTSQSHCSMLPTRNWQGPQNCHPIGNYAQFVANELVSLWGSSPSSICAYSPTEARRNSCGPLSPNNAVFCLLDTTISWDTTFMSLQYSQFGDFAPAVIIAHEWGHRNQALSGLFNNGRTTFQNEQHADCQAGIFAAVEEDRGLLQMGDVMEAFSSLCAASGSSGWFDPTSHGTCSERVAAFQHGYATAKSQLTQVCSTSSLQTTLRICAN
jgi:Putative neutral zinc metallopeptidase